VWHCTTLLWRISNVLHYVKYTWKFCPMRAHENKSVSYESRKPFIREPIRYLIEPRHHWRDHALAYIHNKKTTTVKRLSVFVLKTVRCYHTFSFDSVHRWDHDLFSSILLISLQAMRSVTILSPTKPIFSAPWFLGQSFTINYWLIRRLLSKTPDKRSILLLKYDFFSFSVQFLFFL